MKPFPIGSTEPEERPKCPRCKREMQLAHVVSLDHKERWVYECADCGSEVSITLEALK